MIDFRYHLVSIVSIFLALAVGIVLGAGPLQGEIGDTLNREVAGLRQDKAQLNTQLQQSNAARDGLDAYIAETNAQVLSGALSDRKVALVVFPGSDGAVAEATAAGLRSAGASVVSTTSVTDSWVSVDASSAAARDTAVAEAASRTGVDVSETGAVAPRDVLLAALLTAPKAAGAETVAPAAAVEGLTLLSDADLVEVDTEGFQTADLVVVVAGVVTSGEPEARATAAERWVDLSIAFDDRSTGTVVVAETSTAAAGTSVLVAVRNDATATRGVSTVDNAGTALGQASVVHGLVQQAAGDVGQYGFAGGADAPYAPVPAP
ncbi:copper transporter [Oryzobacter telluris]|uniref:copper transporter n=1 Tax=Oryzobacter telluris TaxID=3149179 RepID=UPI00370DBB05